jgi:glycine amidinotransferase
MLMPLAPGKLLIDNDKMISKMHLLPAALQKWDRIIVPEKCMPGEGLSLASTSIYTNVLPLGHNKILVFSEDLRPDFELVKLLEKNRFDVIHIRLRHSRLFSGGNHCVTLDLHRDEVNQDYFN